MKYKSDVLYQQDFACSAQSYHVDSSQDQISYTMIGASCFLSIIFCKLDFIQIKDVKPISGEIIQWNGAWFLCCFYTV